MTENEKWSEEHRMRLDSTKILIDSQKEIKKSNRMKDKIIILLIVFLFIEPAILFGGFLLYESQFEYVDLYDTAEETNVDLDASGDSANAEYNDVEGNQYNDSSTHNEGGAE